MSATGPPRSGSDLLARVASAPVASPDRAPRTGETVSGSRASVAPRRDNGPFAPLVSFLRAETAGGILLVACAVVALIWANVFPEGYASVWHTDLTVALGSRELSLTLHEWVNDALMTLFFFVVGLEIKREIVQGELRDPKAAALPVVGALGGMVVPAALFLVFNIGRDTAQGWGVPMATDIAMAVGVLALAGRRFVPTSLTVFLLALAIVDDLGAILVIAVAYSEGLSSAWLALATAVVVLTILVRRVGIRPIPAYAVLGVVLWFALHHAGVHATVAGVIMGFIAPTVPLETRSALSSSQAVDLSDPDALSHHLAVARHSISVVERLLHALTPWTSLVIVPIFALANAGVRVDAGIVGDALTAPEVWGVIVGLVVGKPVGITVATMIAVRFGIATLPRNVGWAQVVSVAMVAGIGFTVSVFVADLAFDDAAVLDRAKLGILAASLVAGVVGLLAVRAVGRAAMADVDEDRTLEPPVPI